MPFKMFIYHALLSLIEALGFSMSVPVALVTVVILRVLSVSFGKEMFLQDQYCSK